MAATDAVVGALRVVLGMDTASFEDGAKKASQQAENFGASLKAVFGGTLLSRAVERLFDFLTHSFEEGIKHALEFADQMGKTAQKVGISVEQLTGLKVAADLSDVSMESLSVGLGKLAKNIAEAGRGTGDARKEFEALGITVRDKVTGNLISPIDALIQLSDKFSDAQDGSAKTAAAIALLGRSGKDLIPLLNLGGGSLKEFVKIARDMGLEVSTDTAKRVEAFNDNMKIVGFTMQGISNTVIKELAPALQNLSAEWAGQAKSGDFIKAASEVIVSAIKKIFVTVLQFIEELKQIPEIWALLLEAAKLTWQGIVEVFNKAIEPITTVIQKIVDAIAGPFQKIGVFFTEVGTAIVEKIGGAINFIVGKFPGVNKAAEDASKGIDAALSSPRFIEAGKTVDEIAAKIYALGNVSYETARKKAEEYFTAHEEGAKKANKQLAEQSTKVQDAIDKLKLGAQVTAGAFANLPTGFPELAASLDLVKKNGEGLTNSLAAMQAKFPGLIAAQQQFNQAKITDETLTAAEKYNLQIAQLNANFGTAGQGSDAFLRKQEQLKLTLQQTFADAAVAIVTPMSQAFKTLAEMNSKFAGIAKAAAIAEAIVSTYAAATKALGLNALIPGAGFAAAAAITAAGLANVAKIASTNTNFATGGSFKVGGSGGIDSQLVQFNASPGEMVDVRKPGQTSSIANEITVNMRGRDLINKDMVRDLFAAINAGTRDGYRLKLAEV